MFSKLLRPGMGREVKGGWRRRTRSIWSQQGFSIKNFWRENALLLQVQVSLGEEEAGKSTGSHEGWKLMQEGLGSWAGGWRARGGRDERNH